MHRIILLFLFLVFYSMALYAQPNNPAGDPDVPITGIELLISVGALFGIKKLLGKSKQK